MSNFLYDKALEGFCQGAINLLTDTIKVVLVDETYYTPNSASDQYLSSIAANARVAFTSALTGKTVTNGIFNADGTLFTAVSGSHCESMVIYQDTGDASTSRLIAHLDTGYSNLPITPNGGNIDVAWPTGTNKIFKL
jgi:hypothetical protein